MIVSKRLSLAFCGSLFLTGCEQPAPGQPEANAPATTTAHSHPDEGPHHGQLIELGSEEYHAELVHDDRSVTIYILDDTAKNVTAVDAAEIVINLKHDGKPEQHRLAAKPEAGEAEGRSSRFYLENEDLIHHLEDESAEPKLSITIGGTPYSAAVIHSHEDHDHSHGDHKH